MVDKHLSLYQLTVERGTPLDTAVRKKELVSIILYACIDYGCSFLLLFPILVVANYDLDVNGFMTN